MNNEKLTPLDDAHHPTIKKLVYSYILLVDSFSRYYRYIKTKIN